MSVFSQHEDRKTTDRIRCKGFVWCCGIAAAFIVWMKVQAYFDGRSLRFFIEHSLAFIIEASGVFLVVALIFYGLCAMVYWGMRHRRFSRVHLGGCVFLFLLFWMPTGDLYLVGVKARLLPINQGDYLLFAKEVRTMIGGEADSYVSLRHLAQAHDSGAKIRAEKLLKILEGSVFADWPREMLSVQVQPESVWLTRGSGRLGRIGVRIFDLGPEPKVSEELESGTMTEEYALSSRVIFLRGD